MLASDPGELRPAKHHAAQAPTAMRHLRQEKFATYLKVSPSKMGVKGSLKVWHRVTAVSKRPARTRRATVSSGVELPVGKEDQVSASPSHTPVLTGAYTSMIQWQSSAQCKTPCSCAAHHTA